MYHLILVFSVLFCCEAAGAAGEKAVFGPVRYEVKERYGEDNRYQERFTVAEGLYVIKLENGEKIPERSEFIEFKLNGETLLESDKYGYRFIICIVALRKENLFEIGLKDAKPSGFRRPLLPDRFVTVTVQPFAGTLPRGVYGVQTADDLKGIAGLLSRIKDPESASLAVSALSLEHDPLTRAEAVRKLAGRRNAGNQEFIAALYNDVAVTAAARAEAALALGILKVRSSIPSLVNGILDANEQIRLASAHALKFFPEEETREPLTRMFERLDVIRRGSVIRTMGKSGWKPVNTLLTLAESIDPNVSSTAIGLLGNTGDPRATELLLRLFENPGSREFGAIAAALCETGDSRAKEAIIRAAKDPVKRAGKEAELADALATLGDRDSAVIIAEMINRTDAWQMRFRLQQAYKKLTGTDYREKS